MREVPFVRLLLPLIGGILLYRLWPVPPDFICYLLPFLLLPLAWIAFQPLAYHRRWTSGICVGLFLLIAGYGLSGLEDERLRPGHFRELLEGAETFSGKVLEAEQRGRWHRLQLRVEAARDSLWRGAGGQVLLYLEAEGRPPPRRGRRVLWRGRPQVVGGPRNPQAFDYQKYLAQQHIHHQAFVRSGNWVAGAEPEGFDLLRAARSGRHWCLERLGRHLPGERERAVGQALVLGYKSDLNRELRDAYAGTGAMHILAVSGLHVGLVFMLLQFLLRPLLPDHTRSRWLRLPLVLAGVWGFALLTGAAPSALRAATMFSFLGLGQCLRRRSSVYNTLAASAFLLLVLQPSLLWQVGFQLSYLAVLSIVYFQPRIYRLWLPSAVLPDYLWKLMCVSLAAQLGTLPLSLYYFHQIPLLFWLSSLIAVPTASLILISGLGTLALEAMAPGLSIWPGKLLNLLLHLTNDFIHGLRNLPLDHLPQIWIDGLSLLLLYVCLGLLVLALESRRGKYLLLSMLSLTFMLGRHHLQQEKRLRSTQVLVYHAKETLIDFFHRGQRYTRKAVKLSETDEAYAAENYRIWMGAEAAREVLDSTGQKWPSAALNREGWFQLGPCLGVRLAGAALPPRADQRPELLLVGGKSRASPGPILQDFRPRQVVLESGLSYKNRRQWQEAAKSLGIACHDVKTDGAWLRIFSTKPQDP